jgi:hypothetical protein
MKRNLGRPNFHSYRDVREYINTIVNKSEVIFEDFYLYPDEIESFTEEEKLDLMLLTNFGGDKRLRIYVIHPDTVHIKDYWEDVYEKYRLLF